MPEKIHIGTITRFMSPETPSIVRGRAAVSRPSPLKASAPRSETRGEQQERAAQRHVQQDAARRAAARPPRGPGRCSRDEELRGQQVAARAPARPPGASAACRCAPRRARSRCPTCPCPSGSCRAGRGPGSRRSARPARSPRRAPGAKASARPRGPLQRGVHGEARGAALGLRGVVRRRPAARPPETTSTTRPRPAPARASRFGQHARRRAPARAASGGQPRLRPRARDDRHGQRLRRTAAEGEAQDGGEQDREDEHPEDGLGLADQLAHARAASARRAGERTRSARGLRHRAGSGRSGPRRRPPAWRGGW